MCRMGFLLGEILHGHLDETEIDPICMAIPLSGITATYRHSEFSPSPSPRSDYLPKLSARKTIQDE